MAQCDLNRPARQSPVILEILWGCGAREDGIGTVVFVERREEPTVSPGSQTVIMATIIASVAPHVTTNSRSPSTGLPMKRVSFALNASRISAESNVMAY